MRSPQLDISLGPQFCSNITAVAAFVANNFVAEDGAWLSCVPQDWANVSVLQHKVLTAPPYSSKPTCEHVHLFSNTLFRPLPPPGSHSRPASTPCGVTCV